MRNYLALGDSYTIGEGVAEHERWPELWADLMADQGHIIKQPVHIIAKTGWTTDELLHAIDSEGNIGKWDYVSLLIGVNNQYRGRSVEEYNIEFKQLAEKAIHFAHNKPEQVNVLSIPDWGQTPFGQASGRDTQQIGYEIDAFNNSAQQICRNLGLKFWDITTMTRDNSQNSQMHASDGLHPSGQMYQLWANTLLSP